VPARQRGEDLRQLLGGGLRGALDAGRNDEDVALEGGFELDPDEVVRVVEPATALGVRRAEPLLPSRAMRTSQEATASVITSTKSAPRSIVSMSMKTFSAPKRAERAS
jgi:hypothetical protein